MDPNQQQLLLTGGGKSDPVYVDDVFSTHVYRGNSNLQKLNYIANGIRLGTSNFGASVNFEDGQISYPDSADWDFGNGDFTVECWIRSKQGTNGYYTALGQWGSNFGWMIRYASQDIGTGWSFFFSTNGSNYLTAMGSDISDGNWHHVAVSRSGGYLRTYTDGVRNTNRSTTETFHNSSETFKIGGQSSAGNYFTGLLSNVRVIKGTALYTGASFTPPTGALTNVTNTVFLGCQSALDPGAATVGGSSPTISNTGTVQALAAGPFTGTESGRGGMVMTKVRTAGDPWGVYDTVRGHTKVFSTTSQNGSDTNAATNEMISFDANGFTLGQNQNNAPNTNAQDMVAWTWAKQEGFFDVISYTNAGTGNTKTVNHNLGSVPGMIWIKCSNTHSTSWRIFHKDLGVGADSSLAWTSAVADNTSVFTVMPTASSFTLSADKSDTNASGTAGTNEYIAYIFAGGASTAATSRSVDFDGSGDYLGFANTGSNGAYQLGTGDFTVEFWWKADSTTQGNWNQVIGTQSTGGTDTGLWRIGTRTNANKIYFSSATGGGFDEPAWDANIDDMQWHHVAITRLSGYIYCYVDGVKLVNSGGTNNITRSLTTSNSLFIGYNVRDGNYINGKLSNVRIVKGTAVYTSSFNPPYEPLTDITNTTLLCCNNSSVTGGTVLPVVPTSYGNTAASTDSPFDDSEAYKFGADENKNIIRTGSYIGNGSSNGTEVNTGWQPAYILIKGAESTGTQNWRLLDTRRGLDFAGGYNERLYPSQNSQASAADIIELTGRGFKLLTTDASVNGSGGTYIYMAIRGSDGSVGKPVDQAIKTFNMDYGNASPTIPSYNSGFAVDFGLEKRYMSSSYDWWCTSRLTGGGYVRCASSGAQSGPISDYCWDSEDGYVAAGWANSDTLSWMWRRGKGIDVVAYLGNGRQGRSVPHSLGQNPEMIWVKNRNRTEPWRVYHNGLNGGTNPWEYGLGFDTNQESPVTIWNNTAPTSVDFTINADSGVNHSGENIVAWLFASSNDINDNPISKVGYFSGSNTAKSISVGFRPRFLIIRCSGSNSKPWCVFDSVRGFAAGNDSLLQLDSTAGQITNVNYGEFTATGFDLVGNVSYTNEAGLNYIYYAHA